jgi:hypothetical protein
VLLDGRVATLGGGWATAAGSVGVVIGLAEGGASCQKMACKSLIALSLLSSPLLDVWPNTILWHEGGDGHCGVPEANAVGDNYCVGVTFEESIAPVVGESRANVESVTAPEVPGAPCRWFGVEDDLAPGGSKRGGIKVEGAGQVFPGGYGRLCS